MAPPLNSLLPLFYWQKPIKEVGALTVSLDISQYLVGRKVVLTIFIKRIIIDIMCPVSKKKGLTKESIHRGIV